MRYIIASASDIGTVPVIGSNITFQEVGYSENSTIALEKASHLTLSCSYINSRPGNDNSNCYSLYA
jgi:ribosome biogenesis SPOUT family RNA methylase Rps3